MLEMPRDKTHREMLRELQESLGSDMTKPRGQKCSERTGLWEDAAFKISSVTSASPTRIKYRNTQALNP